MEAIEGLMDEQKTHTRYRLTFLRGRKEGAHIEISEIAEAKDAEEALDTAFRIAEKVRWHIEKVERIL